jgi:ribosomal-protein-alanine N-acetyltransferase
MVRRATPRDFYDIYRINRKCHETPEPSVNLLVTLKQGDVWVYELNGQVVGFLIARYTYAVNLYNIAVLPDYQNQGIATALMTKFYNYFKGYGLTYLHVDSSNPARFLYEKFGYRRTDTKQDYYGPGKDAWYMVKFF